MPADNEQLAIEVIAKIGALEKQMAKAAGVTARAYREMSLSSRKATRQMEADAIRSTLRINRAFASVGSRVGDFGKTFAAGLVTTAGLRAAQQLIDTATRIQNALKVAGLEGEQLTAVYDALYASAQKNAAPIESMATLYSRLSLTQKELGVSQAELINFTDKVSLALRVGGTDAQAASGALLQLSQALGGGVVRAEEFNSVLEGTPTIAQAVAAGLKEAGGSVSRLRTLVVDGKVSSEAFFRAFEAGAATLEAKVASSEMTVSQNFVRLQNVLVDTAGKLDDATSASKIMGGALQELAGFVQGFGAVVSQVSESDLGKFVGWLAGGISKVNELKNALGGLPGVLSAISKANQDVLNGRPIGAGMEGDAIQNRINQAFDGTGATPKTSRLPATPVVKPISLSDYSVPPSTKGGGKGSSSKSVDELQREIAAIKERTSALQAETAAQAGVNPLIDDYGFAVEKARAKQDLLTAAQNAGIAITPAMTANMDALAQGYADASVAAEQLAEKQDNVRQAAENWASTSKDVTSGFIQDMRNGVSATDAVINGLSKLADTLVDNVLDAIFQVKNASSGGGGLFGFLGGLLGGGGSADPWAGMRSVGMPTFAKGGVSDRPSIFAEAGPEAAVPLPDGRRIPVDLRGAGGGHQDVNVAVEVSVADDGALRAYTKRVAQEEARAATTTGISNYNKTMPDRVKQINANPRKR
ncbi:tape measure protein [Pararhizobium sp.]|uniref:tape measure protein n=1 Tax=Pararhizobium sp. TaxID=1977563 RepID=UPI003D108C23